MKTKIEKTLPFVDISATTIGKVDLGAALQILFARAEAMQRCHAAGHDQSQFGTKESGLATPPDGLEFKCGDCSHYSDDCCDHPKVIADPEVKKDAQDGMALVDAEQCCKWWWPKRTDNDDAIADND